MGVEMIAGSCDSTTEVVREAVQPTLTHSQPSITSYINNCHVCHAVLITVCVVGVSVFEPLPLKELLCPQDSVAEFPRFVEHWKFQKIIY